MALVSALPPADQPQVCFQSSWERSSGTASTSMQQSLRGALIGLILSQLPCGKQLMKNPLSYCNK